MQLFIPPALVLVHMFFIRPRAREARKETAKALPSGTACEQTTAYRVVLGKG